MPGKTEIMVCELRLSVSEEMHQWIKYSAACRGNSVASFVRNMIYKEMEQAERKVICRSTDVLIEQIAEKMGIEVPPKSDT